MDALPSEESVSIFARVVYAASRQGKKLTFRKKLFLLLATIGAIVAGSYTFGVTEAITQTGEPEPWHFRIPLIDGATITRLDPYVGCTGHYGTGRFMDISSERANNDEGTPIYAVGDGTIAYVYANWSSGSNYGIYIDQESYGAFFRYAHLAKTYVQVNQQVKQGDLIGLLGNTGYSYGAHLHWEAWTGTNTNYNGIFDIQNVEEWDRDGTGLNDDNDHDNVCNAPGSITAESLDKNHSYHPEGTPLVAGCPNYFNARAFERNVGFNYVTLFDHSNCLGNFKSVFAPGNYNLDTEYGFNDRLRSIYIPSGWSVRLYAHTDSNSLSSNCRTVDMWDLDTDHYEPDANIKIGWDRYYGLTNAQNVTGTPSVIDEWDMTNLQTSVSNGYNMVSRIEVFDNATCTPPPGGLPMVAFTEIGGIGGSGGPIASGDTVTVHADPPYTGTRYGWHDEGKFNLPDYMQNRVTSVGVQSGWSIALFDGLEQTGAYICVIADDPDLIDNTLSDGSNANDRAESVIVFNNSNCGGMNKPDLVADEVFVSITPGTTTFEILKTNEPAYIDWHFQNKGSTTATGQFHTDIWIGDTRYVHYPYSNVGSQVRLGFDDWSEIVPDNGWLKVRLVVDPDNVIDEVDESNNIWEKDFFWDAPDYLEALGCDAVNEPGVLLIENSQCSGNYEYLLLPGTKNLTVVDNAVSSIWVHAGMSTMVYKDSGLLGTQRACFNYNVEDLSQFSWPDETSMDDSISSFEIFFNEFCIRQGSTEGQLVVYNDPNHAGVSASYDEAGKFPVPSNSDNRISSMDLADGWSVMLYEGYNQTGSSVCKTGDDPDFATDTYDDGTPLNDTVSSIEVYQQESCPIPGDANGDGLVNLIDFVILARNFGRTDATGPSDGDFNSDGKVDLSDFVILARNFGKSAGLQAVAAQQDSVRIFFNPAQATLPPNTTFGLMIDARSHSIAAAQIELVFDPTLINLTDEIQTTNLLSTVIKKTTKDEANSTGRIVIVVGIPLGGGPPPSGIFEFAQLPMGRVANEPYQNTSLCIVEQEVQLVDLTPVELTFTSESASIILNQSLPTQGCHKIYLPLILK